MAQLHGPGAQRGRGTRARSLLGVLLLLSLGGCALPGLSRGTAPVATYVLEWTEPAAAPGATAGRPSLSLTPVQAAAGFGGTQLRYVEEPHRLDAYAHHRWAEAPARLLEPLLVRTLEFSGLFGVVAGPTSRVRTDLRLDSELLRLQQVFHDGYSEVELTLRFSLVEVARPHLLATQVIRIREPAPQPDPYGGVLAANRALTRLFVELQGFLAGALVSSPVPPAGGRS